MKELKLPSVYMKLNQGHWPRWYPRWDHPGQSYFEALRFILKPSLPQVPCDITAMMHLSLLKASL